MCMNVLDKPTKIFFSWITTKGTRSLQRRHFLSNYKIFWKYPNLIWKWSAVLFQRGTSTSEPNQSFILTCLHWLWGCFYIPHNNSDWKLKHVNCSASAPGWSRSCQQLLVPKRYVDTGGLIYIHHDSQEPADNNQTTFVLPMAIILNT